MCVCVCGGGGVHHVNMEKRRGVTCYLHDLQGVPCRNFDLSNIFFPSPLYTNIVTGPFLVSIISGSILCKKICKFFSCFEVSRIHVD